LTEYSFDKVKEVCGGKFEGKKESSANISDILIDSRKLISPNGRLFIAIKTSRNDGHNYIEELYNRGVRHFLISASCDWSVYPDATFLLVEDTVQAMQKLAIFHRNHFDYPVIGITGSNGKTIVKEWLFQLLQSDYHIVRSPKSYNSQIGVPLSVWQCNADHNLGVFEAGISEPGEMNELAKIIQPKIGIFTNLGTAHDKNFINHQQKAGEKLELFKQAEHLIYCKDYPAIQAVIIRSEIHHKVKLFTWSKSQDADLKIIDINKGKLSSEIKASHEGNEYKLTIPFSDDASIENVIHCWATMIILNISFEEIKERMKLLHSIAMRLELKDGINNCTIINDSYNSDFNSLSIALDFMDQQHRIGNKTLILSDILQSSQNDLNLYQEVAELIEQKNISKLIGIGTNISAFASQFNVSSNFYQTTNDFLKNHPVSSFNNETILLKGARAFEFEKISKILQRKAHETVMEINLNALVHNLNYYRSLIQNETKIMAMVKASSYGSGSSEIANVLQYHNIDYLTVAYADEGVELRNAGINAPIMVMSPEEQSFDSIIKHNLEPEIYNFRILTVLEDAIKRNLLPANKPVKVHLKIDTGMHRLGFLPEEIPALIERIQSNPLIRIQSVFSHLAGSDDEDFDTFTQHQIGTFNDTYSRISDAFNYKILKHILNSAGITRFPEAHFDMVRLGISLYGIASDPKIQPNLQNVSTLRTTITQIKRIDPGESVGYNRNYKAQQNTKIGTIPIGYADGIDRRLGNGNYKVLVNKTLVPIIGNVCMDMCMIDLSNMHVNEGDRVIIFGNDHPVTEMAKTLNTISYEVLTGISARVKRIYYQE
jgi:alanine racemase